MTTEIQKAQSFEEKMKARVRDSIGDLMSDDDLQKIVERSIEECFFKEQTTYNRYGSVTVKPALINELVKELLTERVDKALDRFISDNAEKVQATLDEIIKDGAGMALVNAMNNRFSQQLSDFSFQVQTNLEQALQNRGL